MDEPAPAIAEAVTTAAPVFISFASADRKQATAVCDALEQRGIPCWLSSRDVAAGENYQEAIVAAIRAAPAMVLVFTAAANNSDEIKKELSLASRFRVPVLALRMAEVEPSDAFAYELATRQWIDGFKQPSRALDSLATRLREVAHGGIGKVRQPASPPDPRGTGLSKPHKRVRRPYAVAFAVILCGLAALAGWLLLRPRPMAEHPLAVRLVAFQLLSPNLPATMADAVGAEINAAFNADGVVGVSTAPAPVGGTGPAFALSGTIQHSGNGVRVLPRLTDERSGLAVWTGTFDYGDDLSRVPRHIAVDAGNIVRCGLFGASTYRKTLPDGVLRDYLQFCQAHWDPSMSEGRKALVPAMRVVRAVPDFSWGWAAVAGAYWKVALGAADDRHLRQAQVAGREAADRAIALDPRNSEALYIKAMLMDERDWPARGDLLQRAVNAQRLDCGCEHHQYGDFLVQVGRVSDGVEQLRQANEMLALYVYTPFSLAKALVVAGQPEEAREYFAASADLAPNTDFADYIRRTAASDTDDLKALSQSTVVPSPSRRAALLGADRALQSGNAEAKLRALQALRALAPAEQDRTVARLLAALGAPADAFRLAQRLLLGQQADPAFLWHPQMRPVLSQPDMPALLNHIGLIGYWRQSKTRPDVCGGQGAPAFCRSI